MCAVSWICVDIYRYLSRYLYTPGKHCVSSAGLGWDQLGAMVMPTLPPSILTPGTCCQWRHGAGHGRWRHNNITTKISRYQCVDTVDIWLQPGPSSPLRCSGPHQQHRQGRADCRATAVGASRGGDQCLHTIYYLPVASISGIYTS